MDYKITRLLTVFTAACIFASLMLGCSPIQAVTIPVNQRTAMLYGKDAPIYLCIFPSKKYASQDKGPMECIDYKAFLDSMAEMEAGPTSL